jgi:hypothetical protein
MSLLSVPAPSTTEALLAELQRVTDECRELIKTPDGTWRQMRLWLLDRRFANLRVAAKPYPIDSGKFVRYTNIVNLYGLYRNCLCHTEVGAASDFMASEPLID